MPTPEKVEDAPKALKLSSNIFSITRWAIVCMGQRKMKLPLFEFPSFVYQIEDFHLKRKVCVQLTKVNKYRTDMQHFETDRQTNLLFDILKNFYIHN